MDKVELLTRVLQAKDRGLTMIFARTKRTVQRVADDLADRGFAAAAVHGDLGQGAREQALRAFRSGKVDVLVATDVAARGIDVTDVTHVINYQCPEDAKTYVHRIGRTGRAGKEGVAVTLVDWDELPRWKMISDDLGLGMPSPPETYSTSEHLYTDLDIPTSATGRLPARSAPARGSTAEYVDSEGDRRQRPQAARAHPRAAARTPSPPRRCAPAGPAAARGAQVERGQARAPEAAPTAGPESSPRRRAAQAPLRWRRPPAEGSGRRRPAPDAAASKPRRRRRAGGARRRRGRRRGRRESHDAAASPGPAAS